MIFAVTLPFLDEIVALFIVAVAIAYVCYRIRLVPIAGFLLAGVIIGPTALGLVSERELVDILAEVGVILLLFTIGLEFSLGKLSRIARAIFVGGGLQVVSSIVVVTGLLMTIGVTWQSGIYTGCLVALSSTAIVLGLLADRKETDTPSGQMSLAVLIFQDLSIVVMVLLVPLLSGSGGSGMDVAWVLGKAVLLIAAILVLARRIVPWILEKVAQTRRQELFLLTVVAICLGTAALSSHAGVSLALGAFLAGLVVSESHYSEQALSDILPLRTIFNAVFFVSVGMLLDVGFLAQNIGLVIAAAVVIIVLKLATTYMSIRVLGYPVRIAAATGMILAQVGEFSFVLERAGRTAGLSPGGMGEAGTQLFIASTVLLMLLTPFQMQLAPSFGAWLTRRLPDGKRGGSVGGDETPEGKGADSESTVDASSMEDHVIVVGYGHAGRRLVQVMNNRNIPFVVIELNSDSVSELRRQGIPALFGDATRSHILEEAGIHAAKLFVMVINDPRVAPRIAYHARYLNPTLQIIARTRYLDDMERLQKMGADVVVPEEMETTVRIFSHVLGAYMIPAEEIDRQIKLLRSEDYGIMRGSIQEAHLMVLEGLDEDGMHTRAVAVRPGAPAAGKSLQELALRRQFGLTVLAVRRGGRTMASPAGDFTVEAGDRLVMVGTADRFNECSGLFRVETPPPDDVATAE